MELVAPADNIPARRLKIGEVETRFRTIESKTAVVRAVGVLRDLVVMEISAKLEGVSADDFRIIVKHLVRIVVLFQRIGIHTEGERLLKVMLGTPLNCGASGTMPKVFVPVTKS